MKKAGKPIRPGDIVKMTGLDKDEVSKILSELKKTGKITKIFSTLPTNLWEVNLA